MEEVSALLQNLFTNNKLSNIEVFNATQKYFEIKENHTWIYKGGIELSFGETVFALAWDHGNDSYDYNLDGGVKALLKDLDFYPVDIKQVDPIAALVDQKITKVDFEWEFYQDFNEDGEMGEEKFYVPIGINLEFENNDLLQIATIETRIEAESLNLIDPLYNLCGDLLISFNNPIEIEQQSMENEEF